MSNTVGCIAEEALNLGEPHGDTSELREQLEQIAEACPHNTGENDLCLLAPVEARIGIVALETSEGQWWLTDQIGEATQVSYPGNIADETIRDGLGTRCMDYEEVVLPLEVIGYASPVPVSDGEEIGALIYKQAKGELIDPSLESFFRHDPSRMTSTQRSLIALSKTVCGGMTGDQLGVRIRASVESGKLHITDQIDGLVLHGNHDNPPAYEDLAVPEGKIILPRPRERNIDIDLTDADVYKFANRI